MARHNEAVIPGLSSTHHAHQHHSFRWRSYWLRHQQAFQASILRLYRTPWSTTVTVAIIAIALILPASLFILIKNLDIVGQGWDRGTQISLFLKQDLSPEKAQHLVEVLEQYPHIKKVHYISPQQGLAEFQRYGGLGDILLELKKNPLPAVIEVEPTAKSQNPADLQELVTTLRTLPAIENVQFNMQWVQRLHGILTIAHRVLWVISALLALGVFLIIGNVIRLAVQEGKDEIEVIRLVGGTNRFIRRPFLYTGGLLSLSGGIISWSVLQLSVYWFNGPVTELAALYASDFYLTTLQTLESLTFLAGATFLGIIAAALAVNHELRGM